MRGCKGEDGCIGQYGACVVGDGPAGVFAVANLLYHNVDVLWVDETFTGGRLFQYGDIPSNTTVRLFLGIAELLPAAMEALTPEQRKEPGGILHTFDPDAGCLLEYGSKMVENLGKSMRSYYKDRLVCVTGRVQTINLFSSEDALTCVYIDKMISKQETVFALVRTVILCTGSEPRIEPQIANFISQMTLPIKVIPHHVALTRRLLADQVLPSDTVAVVGSSHSAVLALWHLMTLDKNRPVCVKNLYRSELKYAVYMPDDWVLYDNTGLKGEAADWAKANLEPSSNPSTLFSELPMKKPSENWKPTPNPELYQLSQQSSSTPKLERIRITDPNLLPAVLQSVTKIVYTVGWERSPLPKLTLDEINVTEGEIGYNFQTGQLQVREKELVGVWGFGIAFPELVIDRQGNKEWSVGMFKFAQYMKRVFNTIAHHCHNSENKN